MHFTSHTSKNKTIKLVSVFAPKQLVDPSVTHTHIRASKLLSSMYKFIECRSKNRQMGYPCKKWGCIGVSFDEKH